jgi:hypothetical protein
MKYKIPINFLLIVFSLLIAVGICEVFLRILGYEPNRRLRGIDNKNVFLYDPFLG